MKHQAARKRQSTNTRQATRKASKTVPRREAGAEEELVRNRVGMQWRYSTRPTDTCATTCAAHDINEANYANKRQGQASSERRAGRAGYEPASDSTVAAASAMVLMLCWRVPILLRMAL